MRVLLTTDTVGGVWTFTRELTEALLEAGHHVALASFGRTPFVEQQLWADTHTSSRFTFFPSDLPLEWQPNNDRALPEGRDILLRIADHFAPDLLHSSQFCFGALDLPIPRLITAHSDVLSWARACRPHGLEPSPWLDRYRTLVQRGLRHATAVVAPTRAALRDLASHFHLPTTQRVIPNGLSLPHAPTSPRRLQAVTAGRLWDEAKGLALLTTLNSPIPILIAGEQPDPTPQHLGHLTRPDLLALFQQSALYLCTSLYEPFGLAPLEAALCGCAILANDIPSLREVWGDAALFFHDAPSLEHLLQDLAANPIALAAAQHRALARAHTFSRNAMLTAHLALYRELTTQQEQHVA